VNGIGDDIDEKIPLKTIALKWLFSQGTSTILLLLILGGMWKIADYAINTAIPDHLKQIQMGYERIETNHAKEVEQLRSTFEKSMDRFERTHKSTDASEEATSTLVRRRVELASEPLLTN